MEEEFAAIHAANSWDLLYRVSYLFVNVDDQLNFESLVPVTFGH